MSTKPVVGVRLSEIDGVWVVQIDTDPGEDDPQLRIYLNEVLIQSPHS